ncbi:hypothetical protein RD792_010513 [Penstemon davidsonii]|uniref:hAT-like transposase RNase-H fold domain-containing protein n=1 Tax=Penstemon davidsonii TaxID=160366 RepID=A0ABR0D217_9LAMI|nr:hypothetical protein RD792_010513 [Penstemon davidsonii]
MSKRKSKQQYCNHIKRRGYVQENESCASNGIIDESDFDGDGAFKALVKFLCCTGVPPNIIGLDSFKKYVKLVNPFFDLESVTVAQNCLEFYNKGKARIKEILTSFDGQISLSMDILEDCKYNQYDSSGDFLDEPTISNYLCLKAHLIDDDWKYKSYVLGISPTLDATPDCFPENIVQKLLSDWGIENKVSNLMSGTSMLNLNDHVLIVKNQLQDKGRLQLDGRLFHVSCCADFLCSLVMVGFAKIEHVIQKILPIVSCGKSSPLWDNTLRILLEAVQSEAEGKYSNSEKDFPSAEEWKKVRDVCKLVQIIYNVAEVVFETKHEGASTYFHNLQELQAKLIEEAKISDPFVRIIAQRMLKMFEKYWENMFLVLAIVTVMDPRYKMKYIEFSSVKYYATSKDARLATVLESIQKVYNSYVTHSAEEPEHLLSDPNSESEDGLSQDVKDRRRSPDFGFNCLDEYNYYIESHTQPWPIAKTELEYYLEEPQCCVVVARC